MNELKAILSFILAVVTIAFGWYLIYLDYVTTPDELGFHGALAIILGVVVLAIVATVKKTVD